MATRSRFCNATAATAKGRPTARPTSLSAAKIGNRHRRLMWGEKAMTATHLKRRDFLIGSSTLMASLAVMGTTGLVMAPDGAWAVSTTVLSSAEAATLIKFARAIFPHKKLKDAIYANVAHSLDAKAAKDDKFKALLQGGLSGLTATHFTKLKYDQQLAALKEMETPPFFQTIRGE